MRISTKRTYGYFLQFFKAKKLLFFIIFFSITFAILCDIYVPLIYKKFFDLLSGVEAYKNADIISQLMKLIFTLGIIYFFEWIFWRITSFTLVKFEASIIRKIYNNCFDYLQKHSYKFFTNNFAGALVRKVGRLARSFEVICDKYFWDMYPLALRIFVSGTIIFLSNKFLGYVVLGWVLIFLTFTLIAVYIKLPYDLARSESDTKLTAFLADTITNNINIKLFSALENEVQNFKEITYDNAKKTKQEWNLSMMIDGIQAAFMMGFEVLILYIALKLWQKGIFTIGDFVLIQSYVFQLMDRLWNFGRIIRDIYRALADGEDMIEILYNEHEIKDLPNAKILKVDKGLIEFKNVCFGYNKKDFVFDRFSLQIKAGEKVAIVGRSGEGKTTLVKMLLRFYDLNDGIIEIDKQDIKKVTQDTLRESISLVPQEPILFHRTIFENIKYAKSEALDEEVYQASKLAFADDFIQKLPDKYETYVGERGIKLSGGERQRVAIARAILKNAPILILDEATSSLDSGAEKMIQEALKTLLRNKTSIVIAHRLSTIMSMDRIIIIENGKVIEQGKHEELLSHKGRYFDLWSTQVRGFIE
ncbi:hypothetical protein A2272_00975 [Candidatus Peregrinibacteria bacterium RIFOXYA12_FULL_33_12]|nr:MAG: hypothetical protein A2263_04055 [Candidatus Peregrinibacteria bacterium RIFOXYA2_FULL_33_21]OGJ45534.1 MAG: hypothetical protein A2272_00975 [Candidatus Peregrinibacteria bacterium RIFOXYA12_FULL_33_12]OGJ51016.1 MAG: hypothetical protein A2307_05650 [Candidatus Peregrinibacteria bacterium RIFOXYB2_FULL_33_20]